MDRGAMLWPKYLEAYGIEDVTGFNQARSIEMLYQIEAPRIIMGTRSVVATMLVILNGTTIEDQLVGLPADLGQQMASAFGVQQGLGTGSNSQMVQVASPAKQGTGQATQSQVEMG